MGCDKIPHSVKVSITQFGEVAERLNAPVLKTGKG